MKLCVLCGTVAGHEYKLGDSDFTIGRDGDNDLVLDTGGISRHHCRLHKEGNTWVVEDLNSTNGVSVNNQRVDGSSEIFDGDSIKLYDVKMLFCDDNFRPTIFAAPKSIQDAIVPAKNDSATIQVPEIKIPKEQQETIIELAHGDSSREKALPWVKIAVLALIICLIALLGYAIASKKQTQTQTHTEQQKEEITNDVQQENTSLLDENALNELKAEPVKPIATQTTTVQENKTLPEAPANRHEPVVHAQQPGIVLVESIPIGAEVLLDKKSVGHSPLVLRDVPAGRHTVELRKEGYEDFKRQIEVPDELPDKPYEMILKAGTLMITTEPSGAWIQEGKQFYGVTPLLLTNLPTGKHEITIYGPGCQQQKETVEITAAKGEKLDLKLKPMLGGIELTTTPPGCNVYLNGIKLGVTQPGKEENNVSAVFSKDSIFAGMALMKIEHPCGISVSGNLMIPTGSNAVQHVKLWIPTHKIIKTDNSELFGMLISQNADGDIVLETLSRRQEKIQKHDIKSLSALDNDEIKVAIEKIGKGKLIAQASIGKQDDVRFRCEELISKIEITSSQELNNYLQNKQVLIWGISKVRLTKENGLITIRLDNGRLHFIFTQGTPASEFNDITEQKPIAIRGNFEGMKNGTAIFKNCILVKE